MNYILRCVIHEFSWKRQLEDLLNLSRRVKISSVLFMEESHQIVMSAYTLDRHKRMAEIYHKIAKRLRSEGIGYSINIATLVGHCDAPLPEKEQIKAVHWTSESLEPNDSTYCILDENWQKYAAEVVRIYASTHPDIIMVDDDFRSLNHNMFLGCFCNLHVRAVSEALGYTITAEELRDSVKSGAESCLAIRKAWMNINFEAQLRALKTFRKVIDLVDPEIRLGLMNSGEPNHSIQGRDMVLMMDAMRGKNEPVSRPLGGAYADTLHEGIVDIHQGMALSMNVIKDTGAYIMSEVENWPHTLYTKSIKSTALQMKMHVLAGADFLSLNIYDYLATPYNQESRFEFLLKSILPELNEIEKLREGKSLCGVGLLWKKDTALYTPCFEKNRILPDRTFDTILPLLGIPTSFNNTDACLVYGDSLAAMSDKEIKNLLSGKTILTSEAIRFLIANGYSDLLGIKVLGVVKEPGTMRFLENSFTGDFAGNLIANNWMRFCYQEREIPLYEALPKTEVISEMTNRDGARIGDAIVIAHNALGGEMVLLPIPVSSWTYSVRSVAMVLRNITLKIMQKSSTPFVVVDGINVAPFVYSDNEGNVIIALVNSGLDDEVVTLRGNESIREVTNLSVSVPALEMKILQLQRGKLL